ncbi:putative Subtilase family protein [Hibiscus syriacus]|uniref:Subtilase family protein n=1 Tax=Hibiscus syriacus TaxID=106335 RepID=A0A6A2YQ98_HIBSY|nr:transcription termination factor MTERF8, chloroplastic-like [Hibiscus syriacus]KAE8681432.1 putative Subtilase family protein [Hibiscus syriacus]
MVTAITMFTDSFWLSSFSVFSNYHTFTTPPKLLSPVSLCANPTARSRQCFSLVSVNKTSGTELWPFKCPQPPNRSLIQCNCVDTVISLHWEKGILFSVFREIGLNEKETKLLLDKNPTLRSTSLNRIRARLLALQSVGINGFGLYRLVIKCASVLIAEEIDSVISFVRDELEGKVKSAQLERLFITTDARFLLGFDHKVKLLIRHEVPREKIAHVLNNVNLNKAICCKSVEEIERTINFLKPYHGIEIIVRRPSVLNYDLDSQLIPKIQFLEELSGGDANATGTVLRKLPAILSYSLEHMEGHVDFMRLYVGLSDREIFKIILVFPNVISASKERKLRPRIEFLKQCGLNSNDIFKFLTRAPLFVALSFEDNLAHKFGFLVKIGYEYRTKEFAAALGAVTRTSCENMQKVIGLFLSYGLSYEDIFHMSKKHPQILQYNPSSLEEKMEYLTKDMGRDVSELLTFPAFLGYKLDDRIKHRYEVKKKTAGTGMSLNKLLSESANRFSTRKKAESLVND